MTEVTDLTPNASSSPQKREQKLRFLNELSTKLQSSLEAEDLYQEIIYQLWKSIKRLQVKLSERGDPGRLTAQAA